MCFGSLFACFPCARVCLWVCVGDGRVHVGMFVGVGVWVSVGSVRVRGGVRARVLLCPLCACVRLACVLGLLV